MTTLIALKMTSEAFTIPLGNSAHQRAEHYCEQHSNFDKAEAIYLNTLSVWAVEYYLTLLGYPTNLAASDSSNLLLQTVTDGAGLMISGFGQVECRPIEAGDTAMSIPPDTWDSRIAYIAVQLDDDLEEASILGFIPGSAPNAKQESVRLEMLRPLSDLTMHLNQFEPIKLVNLADWWQDTFQPGWEAIAQLLNPNQQQPAFRSKPTPSAQMQMVERGCKITLGDRDLSLLVNLQQGEESGYSVCVEFWPADATYLPPGLHMAILDDENVPVLEAHAKDSNETIKMEFNGETGDRFSVRMELESASLTHEFLL